jgi:hypothetical protein
MSCPMGGIGGTGSGGVEGESVEYWKSIQSARERGMAYIEIRLGTLVADVRKSCCAARVAYFMGVAMEEYLLDQVDEGGGYDFAASRVCGLLGRISRRA